MQAFDQKGKTKWKGNKKMWSTRGREVLYVGWIKQWQYILILISRAPWKHGGEVIEEEAEREQKKHLESSGVLFGVQNVCT